jgi:hypothetical protein
MLGAHSVYEFGSRFFRPNPFGHVAAGVPTLIEGPFDPTVGGVDPALLPWVLDPVSSWTAEERTKAGTETGLRSLLRDRYPVWEKLADTAPLTADRGLLLEATPTWEMVLTSDGLQVRSPQVNP